MDTQSGNGDLSDPYLSEMADEYEDGSEYEEVGESEDDGDEDVDVQGSSGRGAGTEEGGDNEAGTSDAPAAAGGKRGLRIRPLAILNSLRPQQLVMRLRRQGKRLQQVLWRLEDASQMGAKAVLKLAVHAVRPALICLITARALRTIQAAGNPIVRMAKLPPEQQMDYYYSRLLGADWQEQLQEDLAEALAEVAEGAVTEDVIADKRLIGAQMLRRMEVEEWDKQRMRHFYYGLYGMGPWYWDMEERLHNPFFIGARAWNGPIEGWVGRNKTFARDGGPTDFRDAAVEAMGRARGAPLPSRTAEELKKREQVSRLDYVLGGRLFADVVDPIKAREAVEVRQQEQQQEEAAAAALGA